MKLNSLAEIVNACAGATIVKFTVVSGGEQEINDNQAGFWKAYCELSNSKVLEVSWSGYQPGYSEMTPSSPGNISFEIKDKL